MVEGQGMAGQRDVRFGFDSSSVATRDIPSGRLSSNFREQSTYNPEGIMEGLRRFPDLTHLHKFYETISYFGTIHLRKIESNAYAVPEMISSFLLPPAQHGLLQVFFLFLRNHQTSRHL